MSNQAQLYNMSSSEDREHGFLGLLSRMTGSAGTPPMVKGCSQPPEDGPGFPASSMGKSRRLSAECPCFGSLAPQLWHTSTIGAGADVSTITNSRALDAHLDLFLVEAAPDYCSADSDVAWVIISVEENDDGAGFLDALDTANGGASRCTMSLASSPSCTDVALDVADHSLHVVVFGGDEEHRHIVLFAVDASVLGAKILRALSSFSVHTPTIFCTTLGQTKSLEAWMLVIPAAVTMAVEMP
ncbi:hypothetical protein MTO96_029696 [Rhipicephalus appendiculatus]